MPVLVLTWAERRRREDEQSIEYNSRSKTGSVVRVPGNVVKMKFGILKMRGLVGMP